MADTKYKLRYLPLFYENGRYKSVRNKLRVNSSCTCTFGDKLAILIIAERVLDY